MIDPKFQSCIDALDLVTATWRESWDLNMPFGRYEADTAALRLMHNIYMHVNGISHLAAIPYTGSHLVSAWVLLRAAFETAVVATWLARDDDWKEREARWLGWMTKEEELWNGIARDLEPRTAVDAARAREKSRVLKDHRESIAAKLPKDSRTRRPSMVDMMREIGLETARYVPYRLASHVIHAGPTCTEWSLAETNKGLRVGEVVKPSQWRNLFCIAGWCVAQPGVLVLGRHNAPAQLATRLVDAQETLTKVTEELTP